MRRPRHLRSVTAGHFGKQGRQHACHLVDRAQTLGGIGATVHRRLQQHRVGTLPAVAREWVDARRLDVARRVEAPHFQPEFLRFYASDVIERLTGARIFEFRNYTVV